VDGVQRHKLIGHEHPVRALCPLEGGLLASADESGIFIIYDRSFRAICTVDNAHISSISCLSYAAAEDALYSASTVIHKMPLAPLRRMRIVTGINLQDADDGTKRFLSLQMPTIVFVQQAFVSLYTTAQIGSFSLTPVAVPEMPPELEGVVSVVRDFGFGELSVTLSFTAVFFSSVAFAVLYFGTMLGQERLQTYAYLYPESTRAVKAWLLVGFFCTAAATVMFVPMVKTLVRGVDCTYIESQEIWSFDALASELIDGMTSQARAVDDVTVGLECWTTHHVLLYALPSAVSLAIYVALSFRLLRAGKALAAIELTPTNLFDFRADSNMPHHYAHPLSTQGVFSDILTVAVKTAIVTAEVTLGSTQPIAMSSIVFVCSGVLAATTAAKPPYFGGGAALANRMQLCVQMGVAWACFVTLLAVLDADTVTDSSNSSSTNSDRLMLLPYGILPAMLIGLWAHPLGSWCLSVAARRGEAAVADGTQENPLREAAFDGQ
jgi:hypothetical protein